MTIDALQARGNQLDITVQNRVLGHSIPTAAPENVLFLHVLGYDAAGREVYQTSYRFEKEAYWFRTMPMWVKSDNRLKDGERRVISFEIPATINRATATLSIKPAMWNGRVLTEVVDSKTQSR